MVKKKALKKVGKRRHPAPDAHDAVDERLRSLDDAVHAALESIAVHAGGPGATEIVTSVLLAIVAKIAWHDTAVTEEEFAGAARQCFRAIAIAHAGCKRGESVPVDEQRARREALN